MHRRLLSTATTTSRLSIAPSTVPRFPPKGSHPPPKDSFAFEREDFDAASWASLQPPPATALSAFAHRIGLGSIFSSPDIIRQACTHHSYVHLFRKHHPNKAEPLTNKQLAALGNALMGMFAAEWVHATWPYLPTRVMKSVVTAHVGPATCESVAREVGAAPLLRWYRAVRYLAHFLFFSFSNREWTP
jgi:large subunit ribosomal protein L44